MYSKINNPITNRKVNINSKKGKIILKKYINQLGGAVGSCITCKDEKNIGTYVPTNEKTGLKYNKHIEKLEGMDDDDDITTKLFYGYGPADNMGLSEQRFLKYFGKDRNNKYPDCEPGKQCILNRCNNYNRLQTATNACYVDKINNWTHYSPGLCTMFKQSKKFKKKFKEATEEAKEIISNSSLARLPKSIQDIALPQIRSSIAGDTLKCPYDEEKILINYPPPKQGKAYADEKEIDFSCDLYKKSVKTINEQGKEEIVQISNNKSLKKILQRDICKWDSNTERKYFTPVSKKHDYKLSDTISYYSMGPYPKKSGYITQFQSTHYVIHITSSKSGCERVYGLSFMENGNIGGKKVMLALPDNYSGIQCRWRAKKCVDYNDGDTTNCMNGKINHFCNDISEINGSKGRTKKDGTYVQGTNYIPRGLLQSSTKLNKFHLKILDYFHRNSFLEHNSDTYHQGFKSFRFDAPHEHRIRYFYGIMLPWDYSQNILGEDATLTTKKLVTASMSLGNSYLASSISIYGQTSKSSSIIFDTINCGSLAKGIVDYPEAFVSDFNMRIDYMRQHEKFTKYQKKRRAMGYDYFSLKKIGVSNSEFSKYIENVNNFDNLLKVLTSFPDNHKSTKYYLAILNAKKKWEYLKKITRTTKLFTKWNEHETQTEILEEISQKTLLDKLISVKKRLNQILNIKMQKEVAKTSEDDTRYDNIPSEEIRLEIDNLNKEITNLTANMDKAREKNYNKILRTYKKPIKHFSQVVNTVTKSKHNKLTIPEISVLDKLNETSRIVSLNKLRDNCEWGKKEGDDFLCYVSYKDGMEFAEKYPHNVTCKQYSRWDHHNHCKTDTGTDLRYDKNRKGRHTFKSRFSGYQTNEYDSDQNVEKVNGKIDCKKSRKYNDIYFDNDPEQKEENKKFKVYKFDNTVSKDTTQNCNLNHFN